MTERICLAVAHSRYLPSVVDGRLASRHESEQLISRDLVARFICPTRPIETVGTLSPFLCLSLSLSLSPPSYRVNDSLWFGPRDLDQYGDEKMPFHWLSFDFPELRRTRKGKETFPLNVPHLVAAPNNNCDIITRRVTLTSSSSSSLVVAVNAVKMPARLSKLSFDGPCIDFVHPWTESCISATAGLGLHSLQESLRIYTTVYIVRAIASKQSSLSLFLFVFPFRQDDLNSSHWRRMSGGVFFYRRSLFAGALTLSVHLHSACTAWPTHPRVRSVRMHRKFRDECTDAVHLHPTRKETCSRKV